MGRGHEWGGERRRLDGRMEKGYIENSQQPILTLLLLLSSLQAVAEGVTEAGEGVLWRYLLQQSNGLCEGSEGGSHSGEDGRVGGGGGRRVGGKRREEKGRGRRREEKAVEGRK